MDEKRRTALEDAARAVGREHGHNAAAWWEQDALGGRTTTRYVAPTARAVLKGMDDGDPEVLDQLPAPDLSMQWADGYSVAQLLEDIDATEDEIQDSRLNDLITLEDAAASAYEDGFLEASNDYIEAACRAVLLEDDYQEQEA